MTAVDDLLSTFSEVSDPTGAFAQFLTVIGQTLEQVQQISEDTDTAVGYQALFDPTVAATLDDPMLVLPYIAMLMGETLPQGVSIEQAIQLVTSVPNQHRGSPQAIADGIRAVLASSDSVVGLVERSTSSGTEDDDALWLVTLASQTPSQPAVQQRILQFVPADIDVYYQCLSEASWATIEAASGPSWAHIETGGKTWAQVQSNLNFTWY